MFSDVFTKLSVILFHFAAVSTVKPYVLASVDEFFGTIDYIVCNELICSVRCEPGSEIDEIIHRHLSAAIQYIWSGGQYAN